MYVPTQFKEQDRGFIESFVDSHPLATVVVPVDGETLIDHIPFMRRQSLTKGETLIAHAAKANPLCKSIAGGIPAVLVFNGASAYVSPSWYPSKAVHHEVVPTWNYVAIHIRGVLRPVEDMTEKYAIVDALTAKMENPNPAPWKTADAPEAYLAKMLHGIVGLTFEIESISAKTKASQNRNVEDRQGVLQGLTTSSAEDAAAVLARFLPDNA